MVSSCSVIECPGSFEHVVAEVPAEGRRRVEIDSSAKNLGQLVLDGDEAESRDVAGLELDENIDVAVRAVVISDCGAEESQAADVPARTQVGDLFHNRFVEWEL